MTAPAALAARSLDLKLEFLWNGSIWTDETPYFRRASAKFEMSAPNEPYLANRQIIQEMKVTLSNQGYRFSPQKAGSIVSGYAARGGAYHVKCRLQMQVNGGALENLFVGYVKWPRENVAQNLVDFTVWDVGEMLRKKYSTPVFTDKKEHELVILYLQKAGLKDGVDFISPAAAAAAGIAPTIDYSSQIVPYSWLDEEDIWSELGDIAQASGAKIFVDRNGMVNFWKGYHWASAATSERITYSQYTSISPLYDDKSFYDEIVVEYAERIPTMVSATLWELPRAKLIAAGKTEEIEARLSTPMLSHVTPQSGVTYNVRYLHGSDANGVVAFNYDPENTWNAQIVRFTVTNNAAVPVVLARYNIMGQGIEGQPSEQYKKRIPTPYHDRRLEVRGNPYVQSRWQAETTAAFLAWWYGAPKLMYEIGGLRGNPARTLGSRLEVEVAGQTATGIIYTLDWDVDLTEAGAIRFTQKVKMMADAPFLGQSYFVVDVDQIGGSKVIWH